LKFWGKNNLKKEIIIVIIGLFIVLAFFPIINGLQNYENQILIQISQTQDKLLIKDKIIGDIYVKYWIHVINGIEIKNDYILLQENQNDNNIIKFEKEWTDLQDIGLNIIQLNLNTIIIDENYISWEKKVLFPEKNDLTNFYSVDTNQLFPLLCWEVRYKNGNTILYDDNGNIIGYGIPTPNEGFSLSGYNDASYPDPWIDWRLNADSWFKKWCDTTTSISLPTIEIISSYVSNPNMNIFFEIAHSVGLPTRFQANAEGIFYTADQLRNDMENRDPIRFAMLCSCEAMREIGPGTLSYEFRKGEMQDTVTVGYVGMESCPGWSVSLQWQDYMFYAMNSNYTIKDAFDLACAEYPIISDCVLFVGDSTIRIWGEDEEPPEKDFILPKVLIIYPTENETVNGTIKITGNAHDLDGSINYVYLKIGDDGDWLKAQGGEQWVLSWNTTTFEDGMYLISAVAIDNHGLQSAVVYKKVMVQNNESKPEPEKNPDLECEGSFSWTNLKPETIINESFIVKNIGDADSSLNWSITSYPIWGTWYFTPSNGDNLKPEDGNIIVNVKVISPDKENKNFSGQILIENKENSSDYEIINISLSTVKYKENNIILSLLEKLIYHFHFFEKILYILL
jgi:hypothetical protein